MVLLSRSTSSSPSSAGLEMMWLIRSWGLVQGGVLVLQGLWKDLTPRILPLTHCKSKGFLRTPHCSAYPSTTAVVPSQIVPLDR